jgi:2-amino-4-hydroxy-6-hydroxymethyldihydropteridine diphosphokinase
MSTAFLGIGTNSGDKVKNLEKAISLTGKVIGKIILSSSVYETDPVGFSSENKFLNMALKVETELSPQQLLSKIFFIEKQLGRVRTTERYTDRTIDIDILIYEDLVLNDKNLVIPHPLLHERRFVLEPLSEIAPDLIHPLFNMTIDSLRRSCMDTSKVIRSTVSLR